MSLDLSKGLSKPLRLAFWLNFSFFVIEIFGAYFTGSVAFLADSIHDFGNTLGIGLALYLEKKAQQKRDSHHSYGFARYSTFAQALSGMLIILGSVFILKESLMRFLNPTSVPQGTGMLLLSLLGVAVNGFAALKMGAFLKPGHVHRHSHAPKHNHGGHDLCHHEISGSEKLYSLHLLEDAVGWLMVGAGALGLLSTQWHWIDPVLGMGLSVYVIYNALRLLGPVASILLQRTPEAFKEQEFRKEAQKIASLVDIHDLHVWTLSEGRYVLSVHAVLQKDLEKGEIKKIKNSLQKIVQSWGNFHMTIETEILDEDCRENCDDTH